MRIRRAQTGICAPCGAVCLRGGPWGVRTFATQGRRESAGEIRLVLRRELRGALFHAQVRRVDDSFLRRPLRKFASCSLPPRYLVERERKVDVVVFGVQGEVAHVIVSVRADEIHGPLADLHRFIVDILRMADFPTAPIVLAAHIVNNRDSIYPHPKELGNTGMWNSHVDNRTTCTPVMPKLSTSLSTPVENYMSVITSRCRSAAKAPAKRCAPERAERHAADS